MIKRYIVFVMGILGFLFVCSCRDEDAKKKDVHVDKVKIPSDAGLDVPTSVRSNLGITFVRVERRGVRKTIRVPGQFELRPEAKHDYTTALSGHITLLVKQFEVVKKGQVLYRLQSPAWRRTQHELGEAWSDIKIKMANIGVGIAVIEETKSAIELLRKRVDALKIAQINKIELNTELIALQQKLKRHISEKMAAETALVAAKQHYKIMLQTTSAISGVNVEKLGKISPESDLPFWSGIQALEVRASSAGIVDRLPITDGGWANAGERVVSTVSPKELRFHAQAPQTDMMQFVTGQSVAITPPLGTSIRLQDSMSGKLSIGFRASALQRTIPLYVIPNSLSEWAKPGVTAYLEVFVAGDDEQQMAIPKGCVVRDGLTDIIFRRDPHNPDRVIKIVADLGVDDGRWVVIESGVKVGDEIVLDGAYELKLASSSQKQRKGHICSDGSWHEGEH